MHRAASLSHLHSLPLSLFVASSFQALPFLGCLCHLCMWMKCCRRYWQMTNDFFKRFIYSGSCKAPPDTHTRTHTLVYSMHIFWPDAVTNVQSLHQLPLHFLHIYKRHKETSTGDHYSVETHAQETRAGGLTADLRRGCLFRIFREKPRFATVKYWAGAGGTN